MITTSNVLSGEYKGDIWFDGEFIPHGESYVHTLTHGLNYATSVFEGLRIYNGKAFKLEEHIDRLIQSAEMIGISVRFSRDEIIIATKEIIERNKLESGYIRPLIWLGSEAVEISGAKNSAHIMIAAWCSERMKLENFPGSLQLNLSRWRKAPPEVMPINCKTAGSYTMLSLAKREALASGFSDAIMLDERGYIAECTTSNIFFVKEGEIVTPIADRCLNGITRQTVIEIAKGLNIPISEQHIKIADLAEMEECFLTGTAMEVKHVDKFHSEELETSFPKRDLTDIIIDNFKKTTRG